MPEVAPPAWPRTVTNRPAAGPVPPGLAELADAWPRLPAAVRAGILAMVRAADEG